MVTNGATTGGRPIVIATLNLLDDLRQWERRGPLVLSGFRLLDPDLIALQEVSLPLDQARLLADEIGGYEVFLCPKTGRKSQREALAILSRLPVVAHDVFAYGLQDRVAQRVVVEHAGTRLSFSNTHMHFDPFQDFTRIALARRLLDWLPRDLPTVLCGDFNAEPTFRSMKALRTRFVSAHVAANGHEPAWTFPTPLDRGPGVRHAARRLILLLAGPLLLRRREPWRGTIDYIYVDEHLAVERCETVFDQPHPDDPSVYPSDHLGLVAAVSPR